MIEIEGDITERERIKRVFEKIETEVQGNLKYVEENIEKDEHLDTVLFKTRKTGEILIDAILECLGIENPELNNQFSKIEYLGKIEFDRSLLDKFHFLRLKGNIGVHEQAVDENLAIKKNAMKILEFIKEILENIETITYTFYETEFKPKQIVASDILKQYDEIFLKAKKQEKIWEKRQRKVEALEFDLKRLRNISFFDFSAKRKKKEIEEKILRLQLENEEIKQEEISTFNLREKVNFEIAIDLVNWVAFKKILYSNKVLFSEKKVEFDEVLGIFIEEYNRRIQEIQEVEKPLMPISELFEYEKFDGTLGSLVWAFAADHDYQFNIRIKHFINDASNFESILRTINDFCIEYNISLSEEDIEHIEKEILQDGNTYQILYSLKKRAWKFKPE